jgi:hypothetical protein
MIFLFRNGSDLPIGTIEILSIIIRLRRNPRRDGFTSIYQETGREEHGTDGGLPAKHAKYTKN